LLSTLNIFACAQVGKIVLQFPEAIALHPAPPPQAEPPAPQSPAAAATEDPEAEVSRLRAQVSALRLEAEKDKAAIASLQTSAGICRISAAALRISASALHMQKHVVFHCAPTRQLAPNTLTRTCRQSCGFSCCRRTGRASSAPSPRLGFQKPQVQTRNLP
jgi:hypothetical protein